MLDKSARKKKWFGEETSEDGVTIDDELNPLSETDVEWSGHVNNFKSITEYTFMLKDSAGCNN